MLRSLLEMQRSVAYFFNVFDDASMWVQGGRRVDESQTATNEATLVSATLKRPYASVEHRGSGCSSDHRWLSGRQRERETQDGTLHQQLCFVCEQFGPLY